MFMRSFPEIPHFVLSSANGNSCFRLTDALEVLSSESTSPKDLKLGASQVFSKDFSFKGEFVVVPTAKICGQSLSVKIPVDMNSIFMKLYVT